MLTRNPSDSMYNPVLLVMLFFFIGFIIHTFPGFGGDVWLFAEWSVYSSTNGLAKAYEARINTYLPVYQYILFAFGKLAGRPEVVYGNIAFVRWITVFFDLAGLWFVWKWLDKRYAYVFLVLFSFLNVSYIYNSVIWGQVDGIGATLAFAAIYLAYTRRPVLSAICAILMLNMKLQTIIFIPVWGLVLLHYIVTSKKWVQLGAALLAMIVVQVLILVPFMSYDKALGQIWASVTTSTAQFPTVGVSAYNFWYLVFPDMSAPGQTADTNIFIGGLAYRTVGYILFFTSSLLALLPLIFATIKSIFKKNEHSPIPGEQILLSASLIGILFFYCNTQMHERYCHPAFIFLTAYAFLSRKWIAYILFSIAYFLNLEFVLRALLIPESYRHKWILSPQFIAILFSITIVVLFFNLYRSFIKGGFGKMQQTP